MSVDFYAIGTALATQIGTTTLASEPPLGGTAIRSASVIAPNNLEVWPYVVVQMPKSAADAIVDNGAQRYDSDFDVYFVIGMASGDSPRMRQTLLLWLGPLLRSTYGAAKLGMPANVLKSYIASWAEEPYEYGGTQYAAWHLVARVWVQDQQPITP